VARPPCPGAGRVRTVRTGTAPGNHRVPAKWLPRGALNAYLDSDTPYIYSTTLQPGQGLISNNVLHDRSGFDDDGEHPRQFYRLRYYQRITGTQEPEYFAQRRQGAKNNATIKDPL
jgi:hypothetical protein